VQFRIDPNTGRLTPTGQVLEVPSPVCVTFVPIE
jgi:6-phosphogluconolactonase (cycloisomerase 2 family)